MATKLCRQPISIAPMMRRTDRHFRFFMRRLTDRTLLYTEMLPASGILEGSLDKRLAFRDCEHPLVLQLGGSDPEALEEAAALAEPFGYDEFNLNLCCPSNKVQHGDFGVCMMDRPERVAEAVQRIQSRTGKPVSIKHRVGFDDKDSYEFVRDFVGTVAEAGCDKFTVHARKAWLDGLSPSENRNVPPLRHEWVYRLKDDFNDCFIELNGGVKTLGEVEQHLDSVDAVMLGRAAYNNPYLFAEVDRRFFDVDKEPPSRADVASSMVEYLNARVAEGETLQHMTRHLLNLFAHRPGASRWRRFLSEEVSRTNASGEILLKALAEMPDEAIASDYKKAS